MLRREALAILTQHCRRGVVSVATMQAVPIWHQLAPDLPLHIDMMGCMGSASAFALGLALGAPDLPVVVVDGDGCLLMQLGSLVTIGHARPANLTLVVMHDRSYATSGNQSIPGAETADLTALAGAAGFPVTYRAGDADQLRRDLARLTEAPGPRMLVLDLAREEPSTQWPAISMKQQINDARGQFLAHWQSPPRSSITLKDQS
jgi:thiamine pyrophosphate-dependent acetolactate synthase large subunit-like protein